MSDRKILTIYIVFAFSILRTKSHSHCTNTYGREICSFLPAPPGKTPLCALPGYTYCEHPEQYPEQRIQHLIQRWQFDHSTFLLDESVEDFTSYYYSPPSYKYGPSKAIQPEKNYLELMNIPRPNYVFDQSSRPANSYIPSQPAQLNYAHNTTQDIGSISSPRSSPVQYQSYKYTKNIRPSPAPVYGPPNIYSTVTLPHVNPYINKVWNRKDVTKYDNAILIRKKRFDNVNRSVRKLHLLNQHFNFTNEHERQKRQSALVGQSLCTSRSQFIMPRAALNNKGNWMFVINMPNLDNKVSQLVKSESCASQVCSGLCSLPAGYTSRCEQKYVQKRLLALEGSGNELYNDVFWFPSCCVCTISNR